MSRIYTIVRFPAADTYKDLLHGKITLTYTVKALFIKNMHIKILFTTLFVILLLCICYIICFTLLFVIQSSECAHREQGQGTGVSKR